MHYKLRCNSTQFVINYKLRNYYKLQRNSATYVFTAVVFLLDNTKQKRSTEGCSKLFKSPETRQVQERLVSTLEHMQVPKLDRTRCPEE